MCIVWNMRNNRILQHKVNTIHAIIVKIKETLFEWSRGNGIFHGVTIGDFMCNWINVIL